MDRVILHVDMDAFFASIEQKDNPSLKGKPVIVGGIGERGVVSTCSYEARKFGVHSAMPLFIAREKCPVGIVVPVRYARYKEISDDIFKIFYSITEKVEALSIDEAFLDITETNYTGEEVAKFIKDEVRKKIGLTLSIGISYNKFLAKLASDWNKPNGIMIIDDSMVPDILMPLPISKVFGIGKKTVEKLNNMSIYIVEDLFQLSEEDLKDIMGKMGHEIYYRIRGIDTRQVEPVRERKSVGKEKTLKINTMNKEDLLVYLLEFSKEISGILNAKGIMGKTITLKYKTGEFESHTRSRTLNDYISSENDIYFFAKEILMEEKITEEIRLIGISVSSLREGKIQQLSLF